MRTISGLCSAFSLNLIVLGASISIEAQASLITNGSFEDTSVDPCPSFIELPLGDTSITGWTVVETSIHYVCMTWDASEGQKSLDLDADAGEAGGISQTFSTIPGAQYAVSFDMAGNWGAPPTIKTMRVSADGQSADFTFDITGRSAHDMGWTRHTWSFVADDSSATLEFRSLTDPSGWGPALDNVSVTPVGPPDHFLCYKAKPTKDSEKFVPRVVSLADQFDAAARDFDVKKPLSLCTPADKNGEGITDPNTHLKGYQIKLTKTDPPQPPDVKHAVRVTNQFGELLLDTLRPDRLLVPTAKSLTGPVDPPGPNNVDHYKCYKVRGSKGAPKFKAILGVSVSDQFIDQPPKLFDLKKPTRLCNPADKNGEGIKNPDTHLLCYQAKPARGQPRHQPVSPIFVNNQFGPEILQTVKEEDLCVPSMKTVLGTLGAISDAEDSDDESNGEE
jgi:choice-of-anchor C domain-containing protein